MPMSEATDRVEKHKNVDMKNSHKVTKTAHKNVSISFIRRKGDFKAIVSHF